jgi:fluoride exporter
MESAFNCLWADDSYQNIILEESSVFVNIMLVGIGGFLGSIGRYLLGNYAQQVSKSIDFPYGTMAVNLLGCFMIGFLAQLAESRGVFSPQTRLLVFVGILGGFTTFSSFGNETLNLFRDAQFLNALGNIGMNVVIGLLMVWVGRSVAFLIWR